MLHSLTIQWVDIQVRFVLSTCADPEGGGGVPELQKYRVLKQYWSGSPEKSQLPIHHSIMGHHWPASETPFKWRFAGGPLMAR